MNFINDLVCRQDSRVAILECFDTGLVKLGSHSRAGIFNHRDKVSEITGVSDGGFDTLVCIYPTDVQRLDTNIPQNIVEVCG